MQSFKTFHYGFNLHFPNERVLFHVFTGYFVPSFVKYLSNSLTVLGGHLSLKELDWGLCSPQTVDLWLRRGDTLAHDSVSVRVGSQKQNICK